jgi:hypothetical protein
MRGEVLRCVTDILEGHFINAVCDDDSVRKEKKRKGRIKRGLSDRLV